MTVYVADHYCVNIFERFRLIWWIQGEQVCYVCLEPISVVCDRLHATVYSTKAAYENASTVYSK